MQRRHLIRQALASVSIVLALASVEMAATPGDQPKASLGMSMEYAESSTGEGRIRVTQLTPGGAAESAGFVPGDLIRTFDGATFKFRNIRGFYRALWEFTPNEPMVLGVLRDGKPLELTIVPEAMSEERRAAFATFVERYDAQCAQGDCDGSGSCDETGLPVRSSALLQSFQQIQVGQALTLTIEKGAEGVVRVHSDEMQLPKNLGVEDLKALPETMQSLEPGSKRRLRVQRNPQGQLIFKSLDGISLLAQEVLSTGRPVVVTVQKHESGEIRYSSDDMKLPQGFELSQMLSQPESRQRLETGMPLKIQAKPGNDGPLTIDWLDP